MPKNSKKIILFLLRNLEPINMNQIAKKLDISVGSVFKILKDLEKREIVNHDNLGNAKYYRVNLKNEGSIKLFELILLEEKRMLTGYPKIYSDEIQKFDGAELIILFGSVLPSKNFKDVDVLFVTNKPKEVVDFCSELSKIRTKPVVPLILKKEDLIKEIKSKKEVILSIIRNGVVLKGQSVFLEVLKNVIIQRYLNS